MGAWLRAARRAGEISAKLAVWRGGAWRRFDCLAGRQFSEGFPDWRRFGRTIAPGRGPREPLMIRAHFDPGGRGLAGQGLALGLADDLWPPGYLAKARLHRQVSTEHC